jgi:hypothetical protein
VFRSFSRYTVWTLGEATPSSTWIWISKDTIWEDFARRLDDVATLPDATQCSRIFRVSFTDEERSDSVDHSDSRSSRPDAVLFLGRISLFWKGGRRRSPGRS